MKAEKAEKPRLGILGISGKMGRELKTLIEGDYRERFASVASPMRGESLDALLKADMVIEFSSPQAALELCRAIQGHSPAVIIGATGWSAEELQELETHAKRIPILKASNFSIGIQICKMTMGLWSSFPEIANWKIRIREWHHTQKKDAPSGTALTLQEAIGKTVAMESIREGDIIGIHEVTFESDAEKLTLIHNAKTRAVFASGALETALRFAGILRASKPPKIPSGRILSLDDLYLRREA